MTAGRKPALITFFVIGIVATLLAGLRTAITPDYTAPPSAEKVVVIGVPSLDWDVLTPENMPHLWQSAESGAVGMLTTRSARSVTCPWDGWVTLGSGNRARYPAPLPEDELPPEPADPLPGEPEPTASETPEPSTPEEQRQEEATEGCLGQRGVVPTVGGQQIGPAVVENRDKVRFGAEPGALGEAVTCSTAVGGSPVLAVGAADADVRTSPSGSSPQEWSSIIADCPLTLVATGHALDRSVAELQALDSAIKSIVEGARQQGATVIIAGTSEAEYKRAGLTTLIMLDPALDHQVLSSPSTGRAPFSQLIDIAPTVLAILGEDQPASMTGRIIHGQDRSGNLTDLVVDFQEADIAASAHISVAGIVFAVFAWVAALAVVLMAILLYRGRSPTRSTRALGTAVGAIPVASLVANVFPWWSTGRPIVAVTLAIGASWVIVTLIAQYGPWRRYRSGPLIAVAAMSFGVLALDVLTGSHLQLNSPFGYNAIVAGRFTGFGNMTFAVFGVGGLVLIALACTWAESRAMRTAVVAVGGLALVVLDGFPGRDFGGVVALVPSLLLMWLIVTGVRLSKLKLAIVFGAGVLAVLAVALVDFLRPPESRTHLGNFISQLMDGTAGTIIVRKLEANWNILTGSVLSVLAFVLVAVVVWQWVQRSSPGRLYLEQRAPYAPAAAIAILSMTILGFAVNDSGIAVTAIGLGIVVPPLLGIIGGSATGSRSAHSTDLRQTHST
ncbi:MAG: hypothetical protein ACK5MR_12840 [Cumulibacter sp.]